VVLNYITAYQMLHRSAKARPGQRMLIHEASASALRCCSWRSWPGVEMYGTCSGQGAAVVRQLGGIPIDYRNSDFVKEIHRLTGDGVDAVFDGVGGDNLWHSRDVLREGGRGDLRIPVEDAWGAHGFRQRRASSDSRVR
jgi:NADPH2:quinone reductase